MHLTYTPMKDVVNKDFTMDYLQKLRGSLLVAARGYAENMAKLMPHCHLDISISESLLDQVIVDAVEDLKRIIDFHPTKKPNIIKEAAYICYWWLKRKPIMVSNNIASLDISDDNKINLLFANEVMMRTYIECRVFDYTNQICHVDTDSFQRNWRIGQGYILYVLTYRVESPKTIEAFLATSTLHPIWKANTDFWNTSK